MTSASPREPNAFLIRNSQNVAFFANNEDVVGSVRIAAQETVL